MQNEKADDLEAEGRRERRIKGSIKVGYIALAFWPFFLFAALMSGDAPGSEKAATNLLIWVFCAGAVPFVYARRGSNRICLGSVQSGQLHSPAADRSDWCVLRWRHRLGNHDGLTDKTSLAAESQSFQMPWKEF
jgi:hypothetical protein